MAEMKDAFVCYRSYIEAIKVLPEDKRWEFFENIANYTLDGAEPNFSENIENAMFRLMKANLDSCGRRYKTSVANGKKGGRPSQKDGAKKPRNNPEKPSKNLNKDCNDNSYLSASEEGNLSSPPPDKNEQFQMGGEWFEYYIDADGERRVRKIDRQP